MLSQSILLKYSVNHDASLSHPRPTLAGTWTLSTMPMEVATKKELICRMLHYLSEILVLQSLL